MSEQTCWVCGDPVERDRSTTIVGVPGARVCFTCDDDTQRANRIHAGCEIRRGIAELERLDKEDD